MLNFTFCNPTKIIFGEGQIKELANEIPISQRVLITYGGGSIKQNGVYDQVKAALKKHKTFEFGGIEPNPRYETLMKAILQARIDKIDFILAVGGGSVIDGTKFIAAGIPWEGEPWDILSKRLPVKKAIPFGTVLTLPATASEMNCGAVITKGKTKDKLSFVQPAVYPKFSILDPTTTYTLPAKQTSNGIVDTFVHVLEQYLTYPADAPLQDRFAEGILLTLIEEAPRVMKNPKDYGARANIMWCATHGLNDLIGMGVPQDWATHMIGHEITAVFEMDHGCTLAIIMPAIMRVCQKEKQEKLLQYADRVWQIKSGTVSERIDAAIAKTRAFFESLGIPTRFRDYKITEKDIPTLLLQLERHKMTALGEHQAITLEVSEKILREAL